MCMGVSWGQVEPAWTSTDAAGLKGRVGRRSSRRRWMDGGPGAGGEVPSVTEDGGVSNKPRPLTWGHCGKWGQTRKDQESELMHCHLL